MAEYIDRENVEKAIAKALVRCGSVKQYEAAKELIAKIPAADVAPVRRGWNASDNGFLCSECSFGDFGGFRGYKPNYCPNCGARMDGAE